MDEHASIVYDLTSYKEETMSWDDDPPPKQYFLATSKRLLFFFCTRPDSKDLKQNPTTQTPQKFIDLQTGLEVLRGDQYVYQSPNKLCIIGHAPTHPLLAQPDWYKVLNIRLDAKIAGALPQPTATPANSKKQPPPPCHAETVVCKIEARDLWVTAKEGSVEADGKEEAKNSELKVEVEQNTEAKAEEQVDKDRDITTAEKHFCSSSITSSLHDDQLHSNLHINNPRTTTGQRTIPPALPTLTTPPDNSTSSVSDSSYR
ncbi:hypothetical protein BGX30_005656, partial [Mortierella sp. GBA39]